MAQLANTGQLLIRSRSIGSALFRSCTICLDATPYRRGSHRSKRFSFIIVTVGCRRTPIDWSVHYAVLFIKIGRELSAIPQSCKRTAYTSGFCLLDVVWKTGSFFRFGAGGDPAFAIFDHGAKHGKAIGTFDDFLTTLRLVIPGIPLFFSLTVKIKM